MIYKVVRTWLRRHGASGSHFSSYVFCCDFQLYICAVNSIWFHTSRALFMSAIYNILVRTYKMHFIETQTVTTSEDGDFVNSSASDVNGFQSR